MIRDVELNDDEALARALQEEYEREVQQSMGSDWRPPPTAPRTERSRTRSQSKSRSKSQSQSQSQTQSSRTSQEAKDARRSKKEARDVRSSTQEASDAEYARMIAMQDQGDWGGQSNYGMRSSREPHVPPVVVGRAVHDQELALRLEQEAMDEAYAKRIAEYQEQQLSASRAHQLAAIDRRCTIHRICSLLFGLAIISAAVGAIIYYAIEGEGTLPDFIPDPEAFRDADPYTDSNPDDANRWRNNGEGLTLPVLNALDQHWHRYFNTAVQEWDNGDPDALLLTTTIVDPDPSCAAIDGALKVCDGDYGDTNWRGINKILLDRGWIIASSARMNENYFNDESEAQRQYTMCHEIGHGFGLPHTDEDFFNRDLGNCMDYTNRPENNKQPAKMNFEFLKELYGTIPGSTPETSTTEEVESSLPGDRKLRSPFLGRLSDWTLKAFDELDLHFTEDSQSEELSALGWKLLHRNEHFESHEMDLGSGLVAQVHMLLPHKD